MSVSVREGKQEDFDWLFELHILTMREYVEPVFGWDETYQERLFFYDFRPSAMTIVKLDDKDIGMFELDRDREGFFLRRLEIHPDFQGRGIGSLVIRDIITEAAETRQKVWLTVLKANTAARKLYERLGFEMIEELTNHYKMICVKN